MESKAVRPVTCRRLGRFLGKTRATVFALLLVGCGGSDRPATVPVEGRVTFAGGPPPAAGTVNFQPIEAAPGFPKRPATGVFATDGTLHVRSYVAGDGLVPGTYRLGVHCWQVEPTMDAPDGVSYVARDFEAPRLTVEADASVVTLNLDVPPAAR